MTHCYCSNLLRFSSNLVKKPGFNLTRPEFCHQMFLQSAIFNVSPKSNDHMQILFGNSNILIPLVLFWWNQIWLNFSLLKDLFHNVYSKSEMQLALWMGRADELAYCLRTFSKVICLVHYQSCNFFHKWQKYYNYFQSQMHLTLWMERPYESAYCLWAFSKVICLVTIRVVISFIISNFVSIECLRIHAFQN